MVSRRCLRSVRFSIADGRGDYVATVSLAKTLPQRATLVVATVTTIDAAANHLVLVLDDGGTLHYDFLVYGVGGRHSGSVIAGVAEVTKRWSSAQTSMPPPVWVEGASK